MMFFFPNSLQMVVNFDLPFFISEIFTGNVLPSFSLRSQFTTEIKLIAIESIYIADRLPFPGLFVEDSFSAMTTQNKIARRVSDYVMMCDLHVIITFGPINEVVVKGLQYDLD